MQIDASTSPRVPASTRIASLDQFRGYTVLGMFVVNFVGSFAVIPAILKHHNTYCSYADTIMPQFFFAVGFAYRLTFLRRSALGSRWAVYGHFVKRNLGLIALGAVLYVGGAAFDEWLQPPSTQSAPFFVRSLRGELFQALVHIGVTCLWIMPVIGTAPMVRIAFALFSASAFLVLSHSFYYDWVMTAPGIDGGPLGFLSWTVPTLAGSLAYDIVIAGERRAAIGRLARWGLVLMLLGYALSCLNLATPPNSPSGGGMGVLLIEPPFVPPTRAVNLWTMSQRAGSLSYLIFGAGLSMAIYALFVWACDVGGMRIGLLGTLGTNALAGYVIHGLVDRMITPFTPRDSPLGVVLAALALFLAVCYGLLRVWEKRGVRVDGPLART
jgi:predicted acyltransferase